MTAHLNLPKLLTAEPQQVAEAIYKGVINKKSTIYVKSIWRLIMLIIVHVPEFIFIKTKLISLKTDCNTIECSCATGAGYCEKYLMVYLIEVWLLLEFLNKN